MSARANHVNTAAHVSIWSVDFDANAHRNGQEMYVKPVSNSAIHLNYKISTYLHTISIDIYNCI